MSGHDEMMADADLAIAGPGEAPPFGDPAWDVHGQEIGRVLRARSRCYGHVLALLAEVEALRAGGWIDVAERLPEPSRRVLVFAPNMPKYPRTDNAIVIGYRYRGGPDPFGREWFVPDFGGEPTHWMPLPPAAGMGGSEEAK